MKRQAWFTRGWRDKSRIEIGERRDKGILRIDVGNCWWHRRALQKRARERWIWNASAENLWWCMLHERNRPVMHTSIFGQKYWSYCFSLAPYLLCTSFHFASNVHPENSTLLTPTIHARPVIDRCTCTGKRGSNEPRKFSCHWERID